MGGGGLGGNPFGMGGMPGGSSSSYMDVDDQGGSPFSGLFGGGGGGRAPRRSQSQSRSRKHTNGGGYESEPEVDLIRPFKVSLEDMYNGATKKLKLTRKMLDGTSEEKPIEINVCFPLWFRAGVLLLGTYNHHF